MKRILFVLVAVCAAAVGAADVVLTPQNGEIVLADTAPKSAQFAVVELNDCLERVFGCRLPEVAQPTPGRISVIVGDSPWGREAGIVTNALERDEFVIKANGNRIYIVGRDNAKVELGADCVAKGRLTCSEHATLFGVYEFLERFAGVRFYFPGDIGTVVPKAEALRIPEGQLKVRPNFMVRSVLLQSDGIAPVPGDSKNQGRWKALEWLRIRTQTDSVPCCHGQKLFMANERFYKTHPEYFALLKRDGKEPERVATEHVKGDFGGQLCQSSAIWDEMFEDCKAYLSGQSAESRGIPRWGDNTRYGWNWNFHGRYIDVMPQDGMVQCLCEKCQKAYDLNREQFATELIWGNTARLANRLKAVGFKDFVLTQMSYPPYRDVPKCDLPPEVWVMVSKMGPWGCACPGKTDAEIDEVRAWTEKLGHKIWMWTYPSKFGVKAAPGVPDMAPRAWATYYKRTVPYSIGAFCESECEKSIFHYLNYYVFSKIAWNPDVDVEALLDEHFRLMFGAAAPEMAQFYSDLERKWTQEVLTRWYPTHDGLDFQVASDAILWRNIYSKRVRDDWTALFDRAAAKVAGDVDSTRRVKFIRREFLDYLKSFGEKFDVAADPDAARRRYAALDPSRNLLAKMEGPVHFVAKDFKNGASRRWPLVGSLKPATRYRISGIVKTRNVVSEKVRPGGFWFEGNLGSSFWFPRGTTVFYGDLDWTYCECEFTTPAKLNGKVEPYVGCLLYRATGEAWLDCLALEEANPSAAESRPAKPPVMMLAREMKSRYPKFRKLGAVSPNGEASPFVFGGKLYRMELSDPTRGLDFSDQRICSEIREAETGRLVSRFAKGCYYTAAFVENGRVYVTGTRIERAADGKSRTGGTIMLFESDDLVHWSSRELLARAGWRFFNTSLTKGPDGYVMAVESNQPKKAGVPFTMFFATSKDMKAWTFMDDKLAFPQDWYAGGPFLVWSHGWYYLSLVTELPCQRYCTYIYRTRDFASWEVGRYNPLLICSDEDRRISPHAHSFTSEQRARIGTAFVCSLSDVEMCDFGGKTYVGYGIGDQQGYYHWAEAWYDGPMAELLENFFQ